MCNVLLPPGFDPIAVNKYIISYRIVSCYIYIISYHHISYHSVSCYIISYIISYRIVSYRIVSYRILSYLIVSYRIISYHIISYIISYHIISYHIIYPYSLSGPSWPVIVRTLYLSPLTYKQNDHSKSIIKQSHYRPNRPWGFQTVEAPTFQDNRHMKVVRWSAVGVDNNVLKCHFEFMTTKL
jgi:hypothetical protein